MGQTPTIVLGSAQVSRRADENAREKADLSPSKSQAAWDLLEKRSNIYSSRPRFIMGQEILSNNMRGLMR